MTKEDVLYSMERYRIDFSLVSNIEGAEYDHQGKKLKKDCQTPQNEVFKRTLSFAREHPDKIGALPWMKPCSELPDEEFVRLIRDNRDIVYGIKLHPFHSPIAPDDDRMEPIYRLAAEYRLPIVSHTGGNEPASVKHLYLAAKKHPELNFVMVHMGLGTDNKEAIELIADLPNLYGDTTWVPLSSTLSALKRCGSEKILFGSDNPIDGRDTYLCNRQGDRSLYQEYFHELKALIPNSDYENIMFRNALRLFHIRIDHS